MEDFKFIFVSYIGGAIVFALLGVGIGVYTVGFAFAAVLLYVLIHYNDEQTKKEQQQKRIERDKKIAKMTKQERREFAEKEKAERKLEERESNIRVREYNIRENQKKLAKKEAQLKKQEQEQTQILSKKQKLAAKTAAAGYLGWKAGKAISKW